MSIITNIQKLSEDSTTEFKAELNEKLEKEVVAFLNSDKGGDIYIGIGDDGNIIGVEQADQLMLTVSDRIKNNILPTCLGLFDVFREVHDENPIIHIVITRGTEKPYYLKKRGQSPAGCYMRVGSGMQQMTVAMIDQLYASRVRNSLSNIPAPAHRTLTFQQLKIYYQEKGFQINEAFLNNLDLYNPDGKLNYAAFLLADENSVSFKVAKYAGTDKCELIENEEYGFCSLLKATHQILDKLNIENKTLTRITGAAEREQHRLIEPRALREAIINAMVHNDYSSEVPPVVEIYSDRISITSYGGLVAGLSREECLAGRSMPRNRELMRIFKDLELVEQLGSGMHRILNAYDSSIFSFSDHFFEICFVFEKAHDGAHDGVHDEVHDEVHDGVHDELTETEAKLLAACSESPKSTPQLLEALGYQARTGHFRKSLSRLCEQRALLELTLPETPRSKNQKYRLTSKGRKLLERSS